MYFSMGSTNIPSQHLEKTIFSLEGIRGKLANASSLEKKNHLLSQEKTVQAYLADNPVISALFKDFSLEEAFAIRSLIAIGQAATVFSGYHGGFPEAEIKPLLKVLLDLERFYSKQGGIIGYHQTVLQLIMSHEKNESADGYRYRKPMGLDLTQDTDEVRQAIFWGIQSLPTMAEIYPVGGSADRLDLHEESTGNPLPAAMLRFEGQTLLEGLMRDVQAREYLYYKLYHTQTITPIAMMVSEEKSNQTYILNLLKENHYFNRPKDKFFLFLQALVPVITKQGNWSMTGPLQLTLKPGGHGVIWKVAQDEGVFAWLKRDHRTAAIVRQINNPLAGTDHTLLALAGLGCKGKKAFGFLSCDRLLNSAEGVNILKEQQEKDGYRYCISNIEYTDMKLKRIEEIPLSPGSPYSQYPSNTNVLYANLAAVQAAARDYPIPGQLINMKTRVPEINPQGELTYVEGGRLESLMQNIADYLTDDFPRQMKDNEHLALKTFIAYNERKKTLSTTKKLYQENESPISTPECALYDRLRNHWELMTTQCGFTMPAMPSLDDFLARGPSFILLFHPALGPLYSVIRQKIRGGALAQGSEIQLEIAEFDSEDVTVEGSLLIRADHVMGSVDENGILRYGEATGKCTLSHVIVKNRGINKQKRQCYWKNEIQREEALQIHISGNGEFVAKDVIFQGNHRIDVPSGCRLTAYQENGRLAFRKEALPSPSWSWSYAFDDAHRIVLCKEANRPLA